MRVIKNFLKEDYFNKLKAAFVDHNPDLPFYIQQRVAFETGPIDKEHFYFTHLLFNNSIKSSYYDLVKPFIWEILKVKALIRVKVNLYPRTDKLIHHDPHNDHDFKHKALVFSLLPSIFFTDSSELMPTTSLSPNSDALVSKLMCPW